MADKDQTTSTESPEEPEKPVAPPLTPPSGTYIIQVPKNQIYRVPPPENALLYQKLSCRKSSNKLLCCSCCLLLFFLLLASAAIIYLVFGLKSPRFTINNASIEFFDLITIISPSIFSLKIFNNIIPTTPSPIGSSESDIPAASTPSPSPASPVWNTLATPSPSLVSPEFNVSFTTINPNNQFGVRYEEGSSVQVFYKEVNLLEGFLPQFFQPAHNVTVFKAILNINPAMDMTSAVADKLVAAEKIGMVPLRVTLRAPVKFKWGPVKTWKMNVKAWCDVMVDNLTAQSKFVLMNCDYNLHHW